MNALYRIAPIALALVLPALPLPAQEPFQRLQMPTAAQVANDWVTPPAEYGPEPYFGMNGPVTIESLASDLDRMKALGYHAVTAQAGGGMTTTYLTPEYFAFFKQFVLEAKKRDMRVWIVDDIGYPSGFAGGIFATEQNAALQMQALTIAQRLPVAAGTQCKQTVPPETVAVAAVDASGKRQAIPVVAGAIDWTAPAGSGDWTVLIVSHVNRTSPTRSDTNPKHTKDSTQPLEDYLNPAATAAYLQATHEGYYKAMPEEFGKTILGFRGDEPDYSIAGLPWTPALFDTFQRAKGYDVRPYLAAILAGQGSRGQTPLPLGDSELRAKADYYDVFSQLFRDGFFKPQGLWCAAHHVEYQTHLNHEEMEMDLTRSEGEFLRDMKYVEVPGIDTIWHQIWTDTVSDFPRLAASASHVYGHPRAFTESFAAYRPEPDITMARYILNEQLVRGVNLFEAMFYPATNPAGTGRGGPSAVMRDPGWPALMQYLRRMSYVLAMGRPAAAVALYLPSDSMWRNDAHADAQFVAAERLLSEHQIDFDIVNLDALGTELQAGKGTFVTASGNAYGAVIVPAASVISLAMLTRLQAFAAGGGKVVFLGSPPSLVYGASIESARAAQPGDFRFASVVAGELPAVPTPPAQPPAAAPGPMLVPAGMLAALDKALGPSSVTLDTPDTAVKVLTRRLADADVYLFFNEGAQPISHTVTLATSGVKVSVWDPVAGAVSPFPADAAKGRATIKLELAPYETRLVTVR